jgi:lysophospholipase L1-like esterase
MSRAAISKDGIEIETKTTSKSTTDRMRGGAIKLLFLLISLIVALLIGEGIIRLLFGKQMVLFPRYHTDATYGDFKIRRIRPNMSFSHTSVDGTFHFVTNNKGFRSNRDINYAKPQGEIRVIALGDSHTQGYEVDQNETFSSVAELALNKSGVKSTVINAGVSGFSTEEEIIFLENEGYKYKPDYVVLGFYNNDFEDNIRANLFALKNDSLQIINHEYTPGVKIQNKIYKFWIFRYLGEHSYLYAFAFNAIWEFYKKGVDRNSKIGKTEYAVASKDPISNSSEALMKKLIVRLGTFCKSNNIKLIIVDIPGIGGKTGSTSSVPKDLQPFFKANCDTLFCYDEMLPAYQNLTLAHVPHGHGHISKETHYMLGQKIAEYVLSDPNFRKSNTAKAKE